MFYVIQVENIKRPLFPVVFSSEFCSVGQLDPACTGLQLAPAVAFLNNGVDTGRDITLALTACRRLSADVQIIDGHTDTVFSIVCRGLHSGFCGLLDSAIQTGLDSSPEGVHALAVFGEPMHDIPVVGCNAFLVAFRMADDVVFIQSVLLAQVDAQFHCFLIDFVEIGSVGQAIFTDFKTDVPHVVGVALGATAAVPCHPLGYLRLSPS